MIPEIIKKGLVKLGGLKPSELEVGANGSQGGYIGRYEDTDFYYKYDKGISRLTLSEDNNQVLIAFEKWLKQKYSTHDLKKGELVYQWNPEDYRK